MALTYQQRGTKLFNKLCEDRPTIVVNNTTYVNYARTLYVSEAGITKYYLSAGSAPCKLSVRMIGNFNCGLYEQHILNTNYL